MSLLDELKKKAEEKKRQAQAAPAGGDQTQRLEQIRPVMAQIHGWLEEFVATLNELGEEVPARIELPGLGEMDDLRQGHYAFQAGEAKDDLPPPLHLMCTLQGQGVRNWVLDNPVAAERLAGELREAGFHIHTLRRRQGPDGRDQVQLALRQEVPVRFTFRVPGEARYIELLERNFERPGIRRHVIAPERFGEGLLDEFGRYVLRQANHFLRDSVSLEVRQKLRERIEREKQEKAREVRQDLHLPLRERLKRLFHREPELRLEYAGREFVLRPGDLPWRIGRGEDANLRVAAPHVSRRHLTILWSEGRFVLEDASRNGTYIRPYDGRELRIHNERIALSGKGFLCPGAPASEDQEHLIHYSS